MSATKKRIPDVKTVAEENPGVDAAQVREVQVLIEELKRSGVRRRGYDIGSPYVRRPLRKGASRFGSPYG